MGYTSAKRGARFLIAIFLAAGSLGLISPDVSVAASFSVKHGQHPRLYTNEHRLNQIRAALKDDSSVIAQAWADTSTHAHRKADELNAGDMPVDVYNANPNHLTGTAQLLGLGYHITGDAKFSRAADRYIAQLVGVMPRSTGGDYSQGGRIEAMGLLYDWFFYALSSYQKNQLATAIKETIPLLSNDICGPGNTVTVNWSCAVMPPSPKAVGGHSFENSKGVTAGLLAIVDEHPELMPLLAVQHENFSKNFDAVRAWVGMDGGYHMGWSYGSTYRSLDAPQLWLSATGVNMVKGWQGKIIDYYIHGLRGDMKFPASGDSFGKDLSGPDIPSFALWSSQLFGNGHARDFYNRWIEPRQTYNRFEELFYWQPNAPTRPVEELPLAKHFRVAGSVLMRDTWDYPNATLVEFKSASFSSRNHHHLDQNAFTVFYKAPLLIDSGTYDKYGSEHFYNYYTRTIAHNSVTVWDPEEVFYRKEENGKTCCSNDGGQKFMPTSNPSLQQIMPGGENSLDGIVNFEHTNWYTYAQGNASKAYSEEKLNQNRGFIRDVLYLRHDNVSDKPVIVTFDRVETVSGKGNLGKRFLLHTVNEPTSVGGLKAGPGIHEMDESLLVVRNGQGVLYSQTVLPENPLIKKIGGKDHEQDYRFLVPVGDNGNSYPLTSSLREEQNKLIPMASKNESQDTGSWRIEVMAQTPQQTEHFLHVMSVADAADAAPPMVENFSTESTAAAMINDVLLVAFSKQHAPVANLTVPYQGPRPDILIAGLIPNKNYSAVNLPAQQGGQPSVVVSPSPGGPLRSNGSGLLEISSTNINGSIGSRFPAVETDSFSTQAASPADFDGDGHLNAEDNCPLVHNADQSDLDGSGRGDACDVLPPGC